MQPYVILELTEIDNFVKEILMNVIRIPVEFINTQEMLRHEFDCVFFGDMYRDMSSDALGELFETHSVPTDYRDYIRSEVSRRMIDLMETHLGTLCDYYHYHVEWIDSRSVVIQKLNQQVLPMRDIRNE